MKEDCCRCVCFTLKNSTYKRLEEAVKDKSNIEKVVKTLVLDFIVENGLPETPQFKECDGCQ